ncbi:MAG: hypothetical protein AAF289_17130, partial [Cyanobacteria bacterium P01_A01_bin.135]
MAFILLHREEPQLRTQMAAQLWPEVAAPEAKANLRRRLHDLKQFIPEGDRWLQVSPKTVHWVMDVGCDLDVAVLDRLADAPALKAASLAELEQAARCYRDNLLPACDAAWIVPHRERFKQQAIALLDTLINRLAAADQPEQLSLALDYGQ